MYPANHYAVRLASSADRRALAQLAALDSQRPLSGTVLVGEIGGAPAAAIALGDRRLIADPFQRTAMLRQVLRMRAQAMAEQSRTPSVEERLRAAFAPFRAHAAR